MRSAARGFTLIELSTVLAVIGLLTVIAVPNYQYLVRRARAEEAHNFLEAIAHAQLAYFRTHGRFLACAPSSDAPHRITGEFDDTRPGWRALGISGSSVHYRYWVELEGNSFVVFAEGDLDGDGVRSTYRFDGATFTVSSENPLE